MRNGAVRGAGSGWHEERVPVPPPVPCRPQASEEREWGRRAARLRAELERERRLDEALRAVRAAGRPRSGRGRLNRSVRLALPLPVQSFPHEHLLACIVLLDCTVSFSQMCVCESWYGNCLL